MNKTFTLFSTGRTFSIPTANHKPLTVLRSYALTVFFSALLLFCFSAFTAGAQGMRYYWVGKGDGTSWNQLNNWSNTSGGNGGAGISNVPTTTNTVVFDAGSTFTGTRQVTISGTVNCDSLIVAGCTTLPILFPSGGTPTINIHGSLILQAGTTIANTMNINFNSNRAQERITTNGVALYNSFPLFSTGTLSTFNGSATYQLTNHTDFHNMTLNAGTLDLNGKNINCNAITLNSGGNITFVGSTIDCKRSWNSSSGPGLTLANTVNSLIRVGIESFFAKANDVFYNVELYWGYGSPGFGNATSTHNVSNGTYNKFTVLKGLTNFNNIVTDSLVISTSTLINFNTVTVNKYFEAKPVGCGGQVRLYSSNPTSSTNRTITLGASAIVNIERAAIHDLIFSKAVTAVNSYDWGNNTNLTVTAPLAGKNLYWIGGGGYWSDPTRWSLTSGGSSANCVPTLADNVFFDANSNNGGTPISITNPVYLDVDAWCNNMTWNGVPGSPGFAIQGNWSIVSNYTLFNPNISKIMVGGSLFFQSTLNFIVENTTYNNGIFFVGNGSNTITTNGVPIPCEFYFQSAAGTGSWKLIDDLILNTSIVLTAEAATGAKQINFRRGSLDLSGRKVIAGGFSGEADGTLIGFSGASSSRSLNIAGATFDLFDQWRYLGGQPLTKLQSANSSIIVGNTDTYSYNSSIYVKSGDYYNNVELRQFQTANIRNSSSGTGIAYFNKVTLSCWTGTVENTSGGFIQPDSLLFTGYGTYTIARSMNVGKYIGTPLDCGGLTTIQNTTTPVTFTILDNTIAQNNQVKIRNTSFNNISMNTTGYPGSYNVSSCIFNGTCNGWNNSLGLALTLYWVGGNGNWTDKNNWSTKSGLSGGYKGDGTGCIPSPFDNVIFDNGSFSGTGQAVTVNGTAYCDNMTWVGTLYSPELRIQSDLNIYGSMQLQSGMTVPNINSTAALRFLTNRTNETIKTNGVAVQPYYIYFSAANKAAGWKFLDNFTAYESARIYFTQGTLDFNGKTWLNFDTFSGNSSTNLILTNATLMSGSSYSSAIFDHTGDLSATNSNISLTSLNVWATISFTCNAGAQYHNLSLGYTSGASFASITRGKFNKITVLSGNVRFNTASSGLIETDTIVIANDNANIYEFFSGSTLRVNKSAYMSGTACSQITLRSTSETSPATWDIRKAAANYSGTTGYGVKDTLLVDYAYIHGIKAITDPISNAYLYKGMHCPDVLWSSNTAWAYGLGASTTPNSPGANTYNQGWARMDLYREGSTPFADDRIVSCTFLPYVLSSVDFGPNPDSKFKWFKVNKATFKAQWDALPGTQQQKFNAIDTKFPLLSTAPEITIYKGGTYLLCMDYGNGCITYDDVLIDLVLVEECTQVKVCDGGLLSADLLHFPPSEYAAIEMETAPGSDVYVPVDLVNFPFTVTKADEGRKIYLYELNADHEFAILQLVIVDPTEPPVGKSQYTFCPGATVETLIASLQTPPNGPISIYYNQNDPSPLSPSVALQNGRTYWATQHKNGCESDDKLAIFIEVKSPCLPYEIWNWEDLAGLFTLMGNTVLWNSYGNKAVLMQNIGVPGEENVCGTPTYGNGSGTLNNGNKMSPNYGLGNGKQYGWYGYQGYTGNTPSGFNPAVINNNCGWNTTYGGWGPNGYNNTFTGTLDGQGFEITGVYGNTEGFFKWMDNATITNLGLILGPKGMVGGDINTGGLCDYVSQSTFSNCYVKGTVSGVYGGNGGLVGMADESTFTNCFTEGLIKCYDPGDPGICGGLVGVAYYSNISNCYSLCNVDALDGTAGGLIGAIGDANVTNCFATGEVKGWAAGGIVGRYDYWSVPPTLTNCFALNQKITATTHAGRVIGQTSTFTGVSNNRAYDGMSVNGSTSVSPAGTLTNQHGLSINCAAITNPATFSSVFTNYANNWTTNYNNYNIGPKVNLPIINKFTSATFSCAKQEPKVQPCNPILPYEIWNWEDLANLQTVINSGDFALYGNKAKLMQNIGVPHGKNECNESNFGNGSTMTDPVIIALHQGDKKFGWYGYQGHTGSSLSYISAIPLTGCGWNGVKGWTSLNFFSTIDFDGQGFEISGLWQKDGNGLFKQINNSTLKNLGVILSEKGIETNSTAGGAGGLAKDAYDSNISNCYVKGTIKATDNASVGGLFNSITTSKIERCFSEGRVETQANSWNCGGITGGALMSEINNCYSLSNVYGALNAGGIVGYIGNAFTGALVNCYATGEVVSAGGTVGGLVGTSVDNGEILNCFALGSKVTGATAGRIFGSAPFGNKVNNRAFNYMKLNGNYVTTGTATNKDGLDIFCAGINNPVTFQNAWSTGSAYANNWTHSYSNYNTASGVNLPILKPFTKTAYSCAMQEPVMDCTIEPYPIWNWDDLNNLRTVMTSSDWENKYGKKAVLMQNIGVPGTNNECGKLNFGNGAATPQNGNIAHNQYGVANVVQPFGWYGYQGYTGPASGYTGAHGNGSGWNGSSGWTPIGNNATPFTGEFDGQGFEISGLWINVATIQQGLFGRINGATIRNLGVNTASTGVKGSDLVGILVGVTAGEVLIENCFANGYVYNTAGSRVGGLVGQVQGANTVINSCFTNVTVGIAGNTAGGIVAEATAAITISNCYSTGNINGNISGSSINLGGIAGTLGTATVKNCYSTCIITAAGNSSGGIGGIVGNSSNATIITNCYAMNKSIDQVTPSSNIGRISGSGFGVITGCYAIDCMLVNGSPIPGTPPATDKNGAHIDYTNATNPATFINAWGPDYANWTILISLSGTTIYNVVSGTNLPHLSAFNTTNFSCAMQGAKVDDCPKGPYEIWNWEDLNNLRNVINTSAWTFKHNKKAVLMQNLGFQGGTNDCGGNNFGNGAATPQNGNIEHPDYNINTNKKYGWYGYQDPACGWDPNEGWLPLSSFDNSEFDGQGFEISGLWINKPMGYLIGLFDRIEKSNIVNLGVNTAPSGITGYEWVGGITGWARHDVNITNCFVNGTITGYSNIGGIVGMAESVPGFEVSINNCYANVTLNCNSNSGGGILGNTVESSVAYISNCYTTGLINGHPTNRSSYLGSIFGGAFNARIYITNCYTTCDILKGNDYIGGIAGTISFANGAASIMNCFALNSKIETGPAATNIGRIVGRLSTLAHVNLSNNRFYAKMSGTMGTNNLNGKNGLPIECDVILDPTTYTGVWGAAYATNWTHTYDPDYNVGGKVNLPILNIFDNTTFSCAMQKPVMEACIEPYQIWNWEDLNDLRNIIASPDWENKYNKKAKLMQNIGFNGGTNDCGEDNFGTEGPGENDKKFGWYGYQDPASGWDTNEGWEPIGDYYNLTGPFTGEFDGQGFEISGLWINRPTYPDGSYQGLFGYCGKTGETVKIENLGVNLAPNGITARGFVGGIAGSCGNATINNCYVNGKITAYYYVGGLVGTLGGNINNCFANILLNSSDGGTGGLVGFGQGSIKNSYSTGKIIVNNPGSIGWGGVGGIFGGVEMNYIDIINCYTTCNIQVTGPVGAGGIVGQNVGLITNCFALNEQITHNTYPSAVKRITSGNTSTLSGNYAYADMLLSGPKPSSGAHNNDDGEDIDCEGILNPTTYSGLWTTDYAANWTHDYDPDYNVGGKVNLPILSVFNNTDFSCAMQKPVMEACLEKEYEIWNWEDLNYLREMLSEYPQTEWDSYGRKAKLMQNIGFNGGKNACGEDNFGIDGPGEDDKKFGWYGYEDPACGWDPIEGWEPINSFVASEFDGQGFEISGLWMERDEYSVIPWGGLFYNVLNSVIKNLGINTSEKGITGYWGVGGLATKADVGSLIENCFVNGYVSATFSEAGGLLGYAWGDASGGKSTVRNCYTNGKVTAPNGAAGLVSSLGDADIENCYSTCDVTGLGNTSGLVSRMESMEGSTISNCYVSGTICGNDAVAGILAEFGPNAPGEISNCFVFSPVINCPGDYVGRILAVDAHQISGGWGYPITLTDNYALETVLVNGAVVTTGTATNEDGLNIDFATATNPLTYSTAWSDYTDNWTTPQAGYNTALDVNLPILSVFNNTDFSCAMQIPRIKGATTAPTSIIISPSAVCPNDLATLTATGGSEGDGCTYQWGTGANCGENILAGEKTATITVNPDATTKYWVRRIGAGTSPCDTTDCAYGTVTVKPIPVITQTQFTACEGTQITYADYAETDAGNIYFYYGAIDAYICHTDYMETTSPALTAGNFQFHARAELDGCWSICTPIDIVVNPPATASDIMASGASICNGKTAYLNASHNFSSLPDPCTVTFRWYDSQNSTIVLGTGTTFNPSPNSTKKYYVSVETCEHCENAFGDRKEVTVIVKDIATATDITVTGDSICASGTITLEASSTITGTNVDFNWYDNSTPATLLYTGNPFTPDPQPASGTEYYVSVFSSDYCENEDNDRLLVTINIRNIATAGDITASKDTICLGQTATLSAATSLTTISDCPATFKWYDSQNSTVVLGTDPTFTTPALYVTEKFYVSVVTCEHCENAFGDRKEVEVTVKKQAAASNITVTGNTICTGEPVVLEAFTAISGSNVEFKWFDDSDPAVLLHTGNVYIPSPKPASGTKYYVSVSSDDYCENAANARLEVTITEDNCVICPSAIICTGTELFFDENLLDFQSSGSYLVFYEDDKITPIPDPSRIYNTPGEYYIYVQAKMDDICIGDKVRILILVKQSPSKPQSILTSTGTNTICANDPITLTADGGDEGDGCSYEWGTGTDCGENAIAGETGISITVYPSATTTYWVRRIGTGFTHCEPTLCASTTITLKPVATAGDITANGTAVCEGKTVSLSASTTLPTTPGCSATFKWYANQTDDVELWSGPNFTTPQLFSTTNYYVSVSTCDYCENAVNTRKEVTVTVNNFAYSTDIVDYCGSSYFWNGKVYDSDTTVTVTLPGSNGCDSIAKLILTLTPNATSTETYIICGSSFTWHGKTYYSSITDNFVIEGGAANGCDSIVTLVLTLKPIPTLIPKTNFALCEGDITLMDLLDSYSPSTAIVQFYGSDGTTPITVTDSVLLVINSPYTFYAQANYLGCESALEQIVVEIIDTCTICPSAKICAGEELVFSTLVADYTPGSVVVFYEDDGVTLITDATRIITIPGNHYFYIQAVKDDICVGKKKRVLVIVELCNCPEITLAKHSDATCESVTYTLTGITFDYADYVTITHDGTGSITTDPAPPVAGAPFILEYIPGAGDAGNIVEIAITTNNPFGSLVCNEASDTLKLTVKSAPTVTIHATHTDTEVCSNAPVEFVLSASMATASSGTVQFSLFKDFSDIINTHTVSPDDSAVVYLRAYDASSGCYSVGCDDTPAASVGNVGPRGNNYPDPEGSIYVAPGGTGNGGVSNPYGTIKAALANAAPGSTVVLRGGTYKEGENLRVDKPVTIKSAEGEWAIIDLTTYNTGNQDHSAVYFRDNASGAKLQAVEVIGGFYAVCVSNLQWYKGHPAVGPSNIIIEDCIIHDSRYDAVKVNPGCNNITIRYNEIYNSGRAITGPQATNGEGNAEGIDNVHGDNMIVQNNYIHDIVGTGIYAKGGAADALIENNVLENINAAGIMVGFDTNLEWMEDASESPAFDYYENIRGTVRNNLIIGSGWEGIGLYASKDAQVYNNTVVNSVKCSSYQVHGGLYFGVAPQNGQTGFGHPANLNPNIHNNVICQWPGSTRPMVDIRYSNEYGGMSALSGNPTMNSNCYFIEGKTASFNDQRTPSLSNGTLSQWQSHISGDAGSISVDPQLDADYMPINPACAGMGIPYPLIVGGAGKSSGRGEGSVCDSIILKVNSLPTVSAKTNYTVCMDEEIDLEDMIAVTTPGALLKFYDNTLKAISPKVAGKNAPGDYTYYVEAELNGCTSAMLPLNFEVLEPLVLSSAYAIAHPSCTNNTLGSIQVHVSGGSGNYEYSLNGGAWTALDPSGIIGGLHAGSYFIHIQDVENDCPGVLSGEIILSNAPGELALEVMNVTHASVCSDAGAGGGGAFTLNVLNGSGAGTYKVNGIGDYPYSATLPAIPVIVETDLLPGNYLIEIHDANGCYAGINVRINSSASTLAISTIDKFEVTDCSDADGEASFYVTNPNGSVFYQLNSGTVVDITTHLPLKVYLMGLGAGKHHLRVFDGCGEVDSTFVIGNLASNLKFTATTTPESLSCDSIMQPGKIKIEITPGVAPFSYRIDGTDNWIELSGTDTTFSAMAGLYTIDVMDDAGCIYTLHHVRVERVDTIIDKCKFTLDLTVYLQGVTQSTGLMSNHLQEKLYSFLVNAELPTNDPYKPNGVVTTYSEILNPKGPADKVVDWVLVEIWGDFTPMPPTVNTLYRLFESRALLLQPDGKVVDITGNKPKFNFVYGTDIRVVVRHRNHLDVVSSVLFSGTKDIIYDFSTASTQALSAAMTLIPPQKDVYGKYCMWAGDFDNNHQLTANDATFLLLQARDGKQNDYCLGDVNMDGLVESLDNTFVSYNTKIGLWGPIRYFIKK